MVASIRSKAYWMYVLFLALPLILGYGITQAFPYTYVKEEAGVTENRVQKASSQWIVHDTVSFILSVILLGLEWKTIQSNKHAVTGLFFFLIIPTWVCTAVAIVKSHQVIIGNSFAAAWLIALFGLIDCGWSFRPRWDQSVWASMAGLMFTGICAGLYHNVNRIAGPVFPLAAFLVSWAYILRLIKRHTTEDEAEEAEEAAGTSRAQAEEAKWKKQDSQLQDGFARLGEREKLVLNSETKLKARAQKVSTREGEAWQEKHDLKRQKSEWAEEMVKGERKSAEGMVKRDLEWSKTMIQGERVLEQKKQALKEEKRALEGEKAQWVARMADEMRLLALRIIDLETRERPALVPRGEENSACKKRKLG